MGSQHMVSQHMGSQHMGQKESEYHVLYANMITQAVNVPDYTVSFEVDLRKTNPSQQQNGTQKTYEGNFLIVL